MGEVQCAQQGPRAQTGKTMIETAALSYGAALLMGLSFGAGPCNITCLPFLGPVLMVSEGGRRQAWRTVAWFSLGRLLSYSLLGVMAGVVGQGARHWLDPDFTGALLGLATIAVGLSLWRGKSSCQVQPSSSEQVVSFSTRQPGSPTQASAGGLLMMGMGMALNPCAPLGMILVAAAATGDALSGGSLGLMFGLGAVLLPTLLFSLLIAHFGQQVRAHMQPWQDPLLKVTAVLLMVLGGLTAIGLIRV